MSQLNSVVTWSRLATRIRQLLKFRFRHIKAFTHTQLIQSSIAFSNDVLVIPLRSEFANMKSLLLSLCIFAAVIAAARGFSSEDAIEALNEKKPENLEDELENFEDKKDSKNDSSVSNPHNCDCDGVCEVLHYTRLPKDVRVRIK